MRDGDISGGTRLSELPLWVEGAADERRDDADDLLQLVQDNEHHTDESTDVAVVEVAAVGRHRDDKRLNEEVRKTA